MGKLAAIVYRLLINAHVAEAKGVPSSSSGGGSHMSSSSLLFLSRLVASLSCAQLQCLGESVNRVTPSMVRLTVYILRRTYMQARRASAKRWWRC
jgi:hypothetical protein